MKAKKPYKHYETIEYELNSQQCAEVALYMYRQWQEAMQPPLLIYKQFPDWLNEIATKSNKSKGVSDE